MNRIFRNMAFYDFYIFRFVNLPNQISCTLRYLPTHNLLAVFRYPHHVIFEIIYSMARPAVIVHTASRLKSSPGKRGLFSHSPSETINIMHPPHDI